MKKLIQKKDLNSFSMWRKIGICNYDAFIYMKYIMFFIFMQGFITAPTIMILEIKSLFIKNNLKSKEIKK